jgi:hypothetical protein
MVRKFLKPVDGAPVRHPDTKALMNPEGEWVDYNSYWVRREAAGEVEEDQEAVPESYDPDAADQPGE